MPFSAMQPTFCMIAARIRSTVELDGVSQMLEKLHNGGLRGKAVIRL
jgi:hypothetical protein